MKKIFKIVKELMKFHLRYRFLITEDIIELKITPKSNSEDEINWIVENNKEGRHQLIFSLNQLIDRQ